MACGCNHNKGGDAASVAGVVAIVLTLALTVYMLTNKSTTQDIHSTGEFVVLGLVLLVVNFVIVAIPIGVIVGIIEIASGEK